MATDEEIVKRLVDNFRKDLEDKDFRAMLVRKVQIKILEKGPIGDKTLPIRAEVTLGLRINYYGENDEARI